MKSFEPIEHFGVARGFVPHVIDRIDEADVEMTDEPIADGPSKYGLSGRYPVGCFSRGLP
jgi:hypothetical protein